jgi:predicted transcriptional regulator
MIMTAKTLTKAEEQVMQYLWELEKGFLKDILELFPEPKPHTNTVSTILKILMEKEFQKINLKILKKKTLIMITFI